MTSNRLYSGVLAIAIAAASVAFLAQSAPAADPGQLVIASYGGSFEDAQTKAFFDTYAKASGVKVVGTTGTGYAKLKAMAASGNVTWDVVSAEGPAYANELKDGLLLPIDYSVVKADGIPPEFRNQYGIGYISFGANLAWDKGKFPNGVTPADFFDPKIKARRVMGEIATSNLEFALLADGVKAADLYPLDVDRAFKVIDRIKDQIVGFKTPSDQQALIQQGEVDMAYTANGRIADAIKAGANWAYTWDASVSDVERWVVPKGTPNVAEAMKFINFAVQPEQQAELTRLIPYGPTNVDALKLLDPAIAKDLPSYPDNAKVGAVLNSEWWRDNSDAVEARWATYIMQ